MSLVLSAQHFTDSLCLDNYEGERDYVPRAPSPPNLRTVTATSNRPPSRAPPPVPRPYPPSEDSTISIEVQRSHTRTRNPFYERSPSPPPQKRSSSNHRPPYVREATDEGTEKALVPSPAVGARDYTYIDGVIDKLDLGTARGRRHVTFTEPESRANNMVSEGQHPDHKEQKTGRGRNANGDGQSDWDLGTTGGGGDGGWDDAPLQEWKW